MSLSEEIMLKLAKLREQKRLEYEAYHKVLSEELAKKTKFFSETTDLFEKAVQDYQMLFNSRVDLAGISTRNVLAGLAEVSTGHASFLTNLGSPQEPTSIDLTCMDDCSEKFQLPSDFPETHSSESSLTFNKTTLAEAIEKARQNCQSFKEQYSFLETSINQARNRIAMARKEYYRSLCQFDKLEKDLLSVSSSFESQKLLDIENHFKRLEQKNQPNLDLLNQKQLPDAVQPSVSPKLVKASTPPPSVSRVKRSISSTSSDSSDDGRPAMSYHSTKKNAIKPHKPSYKNTVILKAVLAPVVCMLAPVIFQAFQNCIGRYLDIKYYNA